jgi:hypothetical protein
MLGKGKMKSKWPLATVYIEGKTKSTLATVAIEGKMKSTLALRVR